MRPDPLGERGEPAMMPEQNDEIEVRLNPRFQVWTKAKVLGFRRDPRKPKGSAPGWVEVEVGGEPKSVRPSSCRPATKSQGLCDTTLTERFAVKCHCDTYAGNLGPCADFLESIVAGRCVYCDHRKECHGLLPFSQDSGEPIEPALKIWREKARAV
jgi:hypothetical protein